MNQFQAVIIDLDGTLLNDRKKVGEKDFSSLHELGKEGICRIIATGRSLYSFSEVIPEEFPIDYLIFAAGGGTFNYQNKQIESSHTIPLNQVKEIVYKLNDLKVDYQIRDKIPNSHKYLFRQFSRSNPDFDRLNTIYKSHIKELKNNDPVFDATRIIVIAQNDEIVELIENNFDAFSIIRATSPIDQKSVWMEIYPPGVNKGNAVRNLCKDLSIDLDQTIGIGNDYNDIDFLNITNRSYMVANAPEDLREQYETIVSNNEDPLTFTLKKVST
jgi:Cof subfamily protein (haloacid dehalogenase superfamily)